MESITKALVFVGKTIIENWILTNYEKTFEAKREQFHFTTSRYMDLNENKCINSTSKQPKMPYHITVPKIKFYLNEESSIYIYIYI